MKSLRDIILSSHSVATRDKVVKWIGHDPERFNQLVKMVSSGEKVLSPRAAWPLSFSAIANPSLAVKHTGTFVKLLGKPDLPDAVKRNLLRLLEKMVIPEKCHGLLMDTCFRFIADPAEKPAIKAFSLGILQKLCAVYPDIRNELIAVINDRWENETAAFRSRAKKILKH